MDVGLALSPDGAGETLLDQARQAEALGFDSVWVSDRPGRPDPLVVLAALARATGRVRLGALGLAGSKRPPGVVAKALASIDRLSGGRLVVALGADETGVEALAEAVEVVRGLLASDGAPFTFTGRHHSVHEARCRPGPAQRPHPPLWVAGDDAAVVELAASAGGWVATAEGYRRQAHRLAGGVIRAVTDAGPLEGSVDEWAGMGVDLLIVPPDRGGLASVAATCTLRPS